MQASRPTSGGTNQAARSNEERRASSSGSAAAAAGAGAMSGAPALPVRAALTSPLGRSAAPSPGATRSSHSAAAAMSLSRPSLEEPTYRSISMDVPPSNDEGAYRSISSLSIDDAGGATDFHGAPVYRSVGYRSMGAVAGGVALNYGDVSKLGKARDSKPDPVVYRVENTKLVSPGVKVAAAAAVKARVMPSFPFLLEPNTHFYVTNKGCTDIANNLNSCFAAHKVDTEFDPEGCHWRAACSSSDCFVDMRVTVYVSSGGETGQNRSRSAQSPQGASSSIKERLCVEFRLSRGDRFEFRRIYRVAVESLQNCGCDLVMMRPMRKPAAAKPKLAAGIPSMEELPPPPLLSSSFEVSPLKEKEEAGDVSPLLGMVRDDCCDVNYEGARILAQLTAAQDTRATLARTDIISALADLVLKGVPEAPAGAAAGSPPAKQALGFAREDSSMLPDPAALARPFAVYALSNLSELMECQEIIAGSQVLPAIIALAAKGAGGPTYVELEERRESARLLSNVAKAFGPQVAQQIAACGPPVKEFYARAMSLQDERLKISVEQVGRVLPGAGSSITAY